MFLHFATCAKILPLWSVSEFVLADSASFVTKMKMKWKHLNDVHFQPELESVLRRHKSQFVSLLKNPVRNSGDAALVRKASSEGIKLSSGDGSSVTQRLPPQMVDEAFIISDMFELNEISSLQLLLQGLSRATWTKHSMNEWMNEGPIYTHDTNNAKFNSCFFKNGPFSASFWFFSFSWYIVRLQLINFASVNDDRKQEGRR